MGLFSVFNKEIAMDLGTANSIVMHKDQIVIDEPSVVAIDTNKDNKIVAVGKEAKPYIGHENDHIKTIRPLKGGVIADFEMAQHMIREFIKKANVTRSILSPALKMVICIPSGITNVEQRAVRESAEQAGAKEIRMIHEPMAAAIGIGLDVTAPMGHMIVDIGGGTSEIAVISLGGIVCNKSIRVAGDEFNENICEYMLAQHYLKIGTPTAERIKISVGSAISELGDDAPEDFEAFGRDTGTGVPMSCRVSYKEVANALDKSITRVETAILQALSETPPELAADIYKEGIYLAGGGALLRGLDQRVSAKMKLKVHVADDPLRAVARGTGMALKNLEKFDFLIR